MFCNGLYDLVKLMSVLSDSPSPLRESCHRILMCCGSQLQCGKRSKVPGGDSAEEKYFMLRSIILLCISPPSVSTSDVALLGMVTQSCIRGPV